MLVPDNPRSSQPERTTAPVARGLARYRVDIAVLSEIHFFEHGRLEEVGTGYTFFWGGRPKAERRDADVAFAIRKDMVGRLPCLPPDEPPPASVGDRQAEYRLVAFACSPFAFQQSTDHEARRPASSR
nr:unnamed protein product [Spirometra erinaceieuropaei]